MKDMKNLDEGELKSVNGGEAQTFYAICSNCGKAHDIARIDPANRLGINLAYTIYCPCGNTFTTSVVL